MWLLITIQMWLLITVQMWLLITIQLWLLITVQTWLLITVHTWLLITIQMWPLFLINVGTDFPCLRGFSFLHASSHRLWGLQGLYSSKLVQQTRQREACRQVVAEGNLRAQWPSPVRMQGHCWGGRKFAVVSWFAIRRGRRTIWQSFMTAICTVVRYRI